MAQRLLVLGAGRHQKSLIQHAEARGVQVVVADYYPDAPGKPFATYPTDTDALDSEACVTLARRYAIDGVITTGTDLAVVTMADVAAALGLPCALTPETARRATNKLEMTRAFARYGVQRPPFLEVTAVDQAAEVAARLSMPVVVKPADSQGQRGARRVDAAADLAEALAAALKESRFGRAIVECFVKGPEITVSAWVQRGEPAILMVTDRVTYNPPLGIGICLQHIFPTIAGRGLLPRIRELIEVIARSYEMREGPLYVQMLISDRDVVVVEGAARLGGGHEASLIPLVTGVDVTGRLIDLALSGEAPRFDYRFSEDAELHALVNFLVAREGVVASSSGFAELIADGTIVEGEMYVKSGHVQKTITNSLGRVGYFIAADASRVALLERTQRAIARLSLVDETGRNLLFVPDDVFINGAR